jgi:methylmalonyl-CoA mutase
MSLDDTPVMALAAGFAPATRDLWRAVAEKSLKGASVDSLARTVEGVAIAPLYAADRDLAAPTSPRISRDHDRPWDVRAPASTHDEVIEALAGGAASVLLAVAGSEARDLTALLDGVLIDVAPIALAAGGDGLVAARALSLAAKSSPAAPLAFHLDPLGADGGDPNTMKGWASAAAELAATHPRASLFLADGARIHNAGGEPAWELAFAVAAGIAYAKSSTEAGLAPADAFTRIVLGLAVDNRPLIGVAKLRAARRMWARVTGTCGAPTPAVIEARSSYRMLTIADPWSNLVRITQAGFAGAVGGADAIVLYPHDRAGGGRDPLGPRFARNAGLILMEEAHLGAVDDPTAGAWACEALTADLARAAWAIFNKIESAGGAAEALRSGMVADAVAASVASLGSSIADKTTRIVGVTDFRADTAPTADSGATPKGLDPIRLEALAQ